MTEFRIESKSNPVIKMAKKLKEKKYRNESRRFLVEGFRFLEEALKSGKKLTRSFMFLKKKKTSESILSLI